MISLLYVDDETTLLDVTRVYLERGGEFSVTACSSARDALDLMETSTFDAVISDYQMPGMDGLLFLKHLRNKGDNVPFILFTGKGREEVAIDALNSGADFYLQKGGEPKSQFAELINKVKQAVQRRQAEMALAASEEKYRDLIENINDVIYSVGADGKISYISPRVSQFGFTAAQVVGAHIVNFVHPDDIERVRERFEEIRNGFLHPLEFHIIDGNGKVRPVLTSSRPVFDGEEFIGIRGLLTDLTGQKSAEAKIQAGEQRYRNVFEAAGEAMLVLDDDSGRILDANRAAGDLFGFSHDELIQMTHDELLIRDDAETAAESGEVFGRHIRYYRSRDGTAFPADILSSRYPQKNRTIAILSIRDITPQKRAEEKMLAAQRLYAVLSQINQCIVRVKDLPTLVSEICRISVEFGHFRMAWVGLLDRESQIFRSVAHAGHEDGYLENTEIPVAGDETIRDPMGVVLIEGKYNVCNDIETDPRMDTWRDEALRRGYLSSAAFPFRLHGDVVGAYILYAPQKDFFNEAEIALLEEIALDISFALDMLDEQARRNHAEQALAGSEERACMLAEILELSSQPFGIGYPDGRFGIVNPALCDLLGYDEPELQQLTWMEITPTEYSQIEDSAIALLVGTGTPQRYEKEYIRKDGSRVPVELFVHRVTDDTGNIRYFYSFVTDITDRKTTEARIRAERDRAQQYLDTIGVMLVVLDPEGKISLINRKGCEILGWSEEELLGRAWTETCLPERIRDEVENVFFRILSGDVAPVEYHENPVLRKDGREQILAFHNTLLRDSDGAVTGILFSGENITTQREMELALRSSEERFRNLIQNATDMIRIISNNGLITYSSPSTLRITGYDPADVIGKNPLDFVHPDDRELVESALSEVFTRCNPGTPTEYRIRRADGSYVEVECIATCLSDVPGINGVVTTTRPITERKQAGEALLESEGRYRAIFEKSADAILVLTSAAGYITDCNPAAEHILGRKREELLGMSADQLSLPDQPGGRLSAELSGEYLFKALEGITQRFSWTFCAKDNRQIQARVTLIPAPVRGEMQVITIIRDCTAQEREGLQSRHLARFPELSPDPVIEVRRDGEVTYANSAARTVLRNLGMPEDPAAYLPEDFEAVVIAIQSETVPYVCREVWIRTTLFSETLAFDQKDSVIRIFARDVTTRTFEKNALEQANRKLNLLSHITRHDIKNKLTGVMGYLELARGSTRDPELTEYLNRAEISANAVRQQIEFTKEYENMGVKTPVWQEVSKVLSEAVSLIESGTVNIEDETRGLSVFADPMFGKVLYCLLENSLAHGGENLKKVRVHGSQSPSGYILVVEDDGIGIPPEQKEKIFNKKAGGREGGLGLFLSREVLSITGITVQETGGPGTGARFEIAVPSGKFQIKSLE